MLLYKHIKHSKITQWKAPWLEQFTLWDNKWSPRNNLKISDAPWFAHTNTSEVVLLCPAGMIINRTSGICKACPGYVLCLSVCLSVFIFVYLTMCLSICLSRYFCACPLSICLFSLSALRSVCLSVYLGFLCLSSVCLSVFLSLCLFCLVFVSIYNVCICIHRREYISTDMMYMCVCMCVCIRVPMCIMHVCVYLYIYVCFMRG
jgi:hypothetical protein